MLEDEAAVMESVAQAKPDVIVHLAAQAGVRYSLENPRAYIESNVLGTFNLMEAARVHGVVMKGPNYRRPDLKQFLD